MLGVVPVRRSPDFAAIPMARLAAVRIVVLTHGGEYAERLLLRLSTRGIVANGLLLVDRLPARAKLRRAGTFRLPPRTLVAGALRRTLARIESPDRWTGLARDVAHGGTLNGDRSLATLRSLEPEYLLLAGVGILSDACLAVPSAGTINAHPGLLPWARGSGVVERSVERRIAIGVTAHLVDAGVDTGPILQRRLVPVVEVDTLDTLKRKTIEACTELMADVVSGLSPEMRLEGPRQHGAFPICTWPTGEEERRIELDVAAGVPREVYTTWRAAAGGDTLAGDFVPPTSGEAR